MKALRSVRGILRSPKCPQPTQARVLEPPVTGYPHTPADGRVPAYAGFTAEALYA